MKRRTILLLTVFGVILLSGFLLQSFFISATTLAEPKNITVIVPDKNSPNSTVLLPDKISQSTDQDYTITFVLGEDDKLYWINNNSLNNNDLTQIEFNEKSVKKVIDSIKLTLEDDKDLSVKIVSSKETTYKNIVEILDIIQVLKIKKYKVEGQK